MPRTFLNLSEWKCLKIKIEQAKCGDILFVKNKNNKKFLSHSALILDTDRIFHCTPRFGTAVIESKDEFFKIYEQSLSFKEMICYIDPRNQQLRKIHRGIFIEEDPISTSDL